ncbi:MAG: hypothetical protein AABW47_01395 [Nanoarchaeota archaeon]
MKNKILNKKSEKKFLVLIIGLVFIICMFNFVSAGSGIFNIANKSDSTQSYFFVNGRDNG